MTRLGPIIALLACAGLGYLAGHNRTTAERCSSPGSESPAAVNRIVPASAPVETPLVSKLLPERAETPSRKTSADSKSLTPHRTTGEEPGAAIALVDGQLSPGGNFRYSFARKAYIPVDKGNRRYTHGGQPVGAAHLIEHGHAPSAVAVWTQVEREIAHANDHAMLGAVRPAAAPVQSSCPNGQCGNPSYGRGLFGRRR